MGILYSIFIYVYTGILHLASLFSHKATLWVKGRKNIRKKIADTLGSEKSPIIWFHAASLGEFEQGRPVIEQIKTDYPTHKILLTFFSPSGYELQKTYKGADYVFYLPADTPANARFFVKTVKPVLALFIKYEFWFNYLQQLRRREVPVYYVSAVFRPEHYFFRPYGIWALKRLREINGFFVQDERSVQLLSSHGIASVIKSGDTRFDRVMSIASNAKDFPALKNFAGTRKVIIAGSTWPEDDKLMTTFINKPGNTPKFIIAPHEINKTYIEKLRQSIHKKNILFSELSSENASNYDVLIVDGIGYLSHLYRYAHIAFIGGGFDKGIHNILEAACFGLPVVFGPKYKKFNEAVTLTEIGGAFSVNSYEAFEKTILHLLNDVNYYTKVSEMNKKFVRDNSGACRIIVNEIKNKFE